MKSAELVFVDIKKMPKTHEELKNWVINKSREPRYLMHTDVAKDVQDIIAGGPVPTHIKPIWPFIAFTAFNTLPKEFKDIYGINSSKVKTFLVNFNLFLLIICSSIAIGSGYIINNFYDYEKDLINKPVKSEIDKIIRKRTIKKS